MISGKGRGGIGQAKAEAQLGSRSCHANGTCAVVMVVVTRASEGTKPDRPGDFAGPVWFHRRMLALG
jgi:hypothetical protein